MSNLLSIPTASFDTHLKHLHDSIFTGEAIDKNPFRNNIWRIILLPYGINMGEQDFYTLGSVARKCGDNELVIADAETIEPEEAAVIIPWSYSTLTEARLRRGSFIGLMDAHFFGYSAMWGAISGCSVDDILCIGGNESFMSTLIGQFGGEEVLRDRFFQFASHEWSIGWEIRERLLIAAGWLPYWK